MLVQNEMLTTDEWTLATSGHWPQTEGARRIKHPSRETEQAPWLKPGNASGHWPQAVIGRGSGGRQVEHPAHVTDKGRLSGHWALLAAFRVDLRTSLKVGKGMLTQCQ